MIHPFTSRRKFVFVNIRKPYFFNKYIVPSSNLPLADYMSLSGKFKALGSENSYIFRTLPKMSTHEDENTGEAEMGIIEGE